MQYSHTRRATLGGDADIGQVAALIGDPRRARMLSAMLDGRAHPASEIAVAAGVSRSAATAHLQRLVAGGLVEVKQRGRFRYHSLASPLVAQLIESMAAVAPQTAITSLKESTAAEAIREARSCYDHLAGRLGVEVADALRAAEAIIFDDPSPHARPGSSAAVVRLGPSAVTIFTGLGVDIPLLGKTPSRRPMLKLCIDWSERRHHIAGALGHAVLDAFLRQGVVTRRPAGRALQLTGAGRTQLLAVLPTIANL